MIVSILALQIAAAQPAATSSVIRVNQLGYLPNGPKTAVMCVVAESAAGASRTTPRSISFSVQDTTGKAVLAGRRANASGPFGPCADTYRLNFSSLRTAGVYRIVASDSVRSPNVRINTHVYAGAADTLLYYMRQQRSGYNPTLKDPVPKRDRLNVDHPTPTGAVIN